MKINFLNQNTYTPKRQTAPAAQQFNANPFEQTFFCGLAKGQNAAENACIKLLRKVRDGRFRKFTENDITEMITDLRKTPQKDEKEKILEEVLSLKNEENGEKPGRFFIKRVINLVSGRPETERYAILDYALNDLSTATEPLAVFTKLPEKIKDHFAKMLVKINEVNDHNLYRSENARTYTIDSLYDHFRVLLYAQDDIKRLPPDKIKEYKFDAISTLHDDLKFFEKSDTYSGNEGKSKVLAVGKKIYNYFLENFT